MARAARELIQHRRRGNADARADGAFAWPLAVLVVLALATLWGSLWFGSWRLDESRLAVERQIVTAQLDGRLADLARIASDFSWWNDAYYRLGPTVDVAWADSNIGPYLYHLHGIDLSAVVTPAGAILYARMQGKPSSIQLGPDLQELLSRSSGDSRHGVSPAEAFLRLASGTYEVAVSPILPEEETEPPVGAQGAERLVLARRIDSRLLAPLATGYAIADPKVVDQPPPDREVLPLSGVDGAAVAYLAWQGSRPGSVLRRWTAPALFAALAVFGLFAWLSLHNLRRTAALRVAHEAAVRRSAERQRLEKMHHAFVATVSHELRTPLTAIDGSLALVDGGAAGVLPEKAQRLVTIARRNSKRLVSLVNDILEIERLEAGLVDLQLSAVDLRRLAEQGLEVNQPYAERTGSTLELVAGPDRPEVLGDPDRLLQVLTNLVSNAVKYSPPGSLVRIVVSKRNGRARVEVIDQGAGVADEFRDRLFQRFSRASDEATRRASGSGLGLYIARVLIERQNGHIDVDSVPGHGATFWFELPLLELEPPAVPVAHRTAIAGG